MSALIRLSTARSSPNIRNESSSKHLRQQQPTNSLYLLRTTNSITPLNTWSHSHFFQPSRFSSSVHPFTSTLHQSKPQSSPQLHTSPRRSKPAVDEEGEIPRGDEPIINYYNRWLASEEKTTTSTTTESGSEGKQKEKKEDEAGKSVKAIQESIYEELKTVSTTGSSLLPKEVVAELDRFIVGQTDAKKAVAIALRNRWRRHQLDSVMREEVIPKNILMIGPTGCGKTEIARRLAKIQQAPFIKVEATKFTEVGYHGRDVDQIIRDLVDIAIHQTKVQLTQRFAPKVKKLVDEKIIDLLVGRSPEEQRKTYREFLDKGELETRTVEIDVPEGASRQGYDNVSLLKDNMVATFDVSQIFPLFGERQGRTKRRSMTVAEARPFLTQTELDKIITKDLVHKKAIEAVQQDGIVFIDEIDKICVRSDTVYRGPDPSSEGVQRDLLPLIEGTIINTKIGNVDTSKILFVASGAFHSCKPSDMLAELQGRLPIRVELKGLGQQDLFRILTEPENNMLKQNIELMKTERINLKFTDGAISEIARVAAEVNESVENIGARRLHTVMERIMEEVSFNCDQYSDKEYVITEEYVRQHLSDMLLKTDLSRFIL